MKKPILFILCIILTAQMSYSQATNTQINQLIGKWKSIRNEDKGLEINIKFNKDGSVKYDVSVNLKGNYILKGNRLVSYFKDLKTNKTEVDTSIIEHKGNTLIQKSIVTGNKIKLKRLGKRNDNSKLLIGKWRSDDYNGYRAITEFTPYYGIKVKLLIKSFDGSFLVDKNMVTVFSTTTYRMRMNYKITKNIMTLHNLENGKDLTMVKIAK